MDPGGHTVMGEAVAARSMRKPVLEMDTRRPNAWRVGGLDAAARGALTECVQLFQSSAWSPAHAVDKHGSTALMWAAGGDHLDVVKWLLGESHGSPSTALDPPMDPNVGNKEGRTALMWACKTAAERTVAYLLSLTTTDPTLTMKSGSGAFDWAVFGGAIPVMELVAASPRVDIAAKNLAGCSAIMWASSAGHVEVLRWLAVHGLDFDGINDHGQGCISKAAWFGHGRAVHWLVCAEDGPKLGHHLALTEHENGLTVEQLTHCAGHFALACWLGVLTAVARQPQLPVDTNAQESTVRQCCVGMKLPEAISENPSHELATIEWLPWREEQLVRLGFEVDTRQEGNEDTGCQSIDAMESLVQHNKPLTPTARRWRKAVLLAARTATEQAAETTTENASRSQSYDTPTTPVARALQIAKPGVYTKVMSILATHDRQER